MKNKENREKLLGSIHPTKSGVDCQIINYVNNREVVVKFLDEFGFEKPASLQAIRSGNVSNPYHRSVQGVGFMGVGVYASTVNWKMTPAYRRWSALVARCYSQELRKEKQYYSEVSMSDDWLNFQNFAKWYYNQPGHDLGWELDKDLFCETSTYYSEDTCVLLPKELNLVIVGINKFSENCFYHAKAGLYSFKNVIDDKTVYFKDRNDCLIQYLDVKANRIQSLADKWLGKIPHRAYKRLCELASVLHERKSLYYS